MWRIPVLLVSRARRRYVAMFVGFLIIIAVVGVWCGVWPDWSAVVASIVVVLVALPAWFRDTTEAPSSSASQLAPTSSASQPAPTSSASQPETSQMPIASQLPLDSGDLAALSHALATAIWRKRDIERIAGQAGIPRAYVDFEGNAQTLWDEVLNQAQKRPAKTFSAVLALAVDQAPSLHHAEVVAFWQARLGRGESGV